MRQRAGGPTGGGPTDVEASTRTAPAGSLRRRAEFLSRSSFKDPADPQWAADPPTRRPADPEMKTYEDALRNPKTSRWARLRS
ncbi:hypothetical protein ACFWBB_04510 [Streptomyces sp. NPDC060000]|uniref:hypothetical protein n=1 Tax=Streptomyces sp. NPDC060000 TaxID=3347031 RepID=UPI0036C63502